MVRSHVRPPKLFDMTVELSEEEVDGSIPSRPTVLEKKGRREWRYSSIKRFFFSSKIILNCLKKACRPRRLKETKYSWEKTTGQMNFLLAIFISILWMYPLILPPTPPRYVSVPSSSMIPSCSATSTVKTEIVAPESINAEVL